MGGQNHMKPRKSFTLMELVVSVGILAGSISAIMYSYIVFSELSQLTKNTSLAVGVAQAKLEDIRSDSFDDIDQYKNQLFFPVSASLYPQDINYQSLDYRGIVYVSDISSNLKQVTVVICWRQGARVIGEDWVFDAGADPTAHAQAVSPVTITTLMTER